MRKKICEQNVLEIPRLNQSQNCECLSRYGDTGQGSLPLGWKVVVFGKVKFWLSFFSAGIYTCDNKGPQIPELGRMR